MKVTELIAKLQAVVDEHGDMEVGYIDNGPFAENGGWVEPEVCVCDDSSKPSDGIKIVVL